MVTFVAIVILALIYITGAFPSISSDQRTLQSILQNWDNAGNMYYPLDIKQIPSETINDLYGRKIELEATGQHSIDWTKYAYVNYVTNIDYLCNGLLSFKQLKEKYHTKAKLVMLIGENVFHNEDLESQKHVQQLINKIKTIDPEQVIVKNVSNVVKTDDTSSWQESLTKLYAFSLVEYERIIYFDNDAILQDNMDELFFLPPYVKFAAPLAYWLLSKNDFEESKKELDMDMNSPNLEEHISILKERVKKGEEVYNYLPRLPHNLYIKDEEIRDLFDSTQQNSPVPERTQKTKAIWSSQIMVIKPSVETYNLIKHLLPSAVGQSGVYDMDLLNTDLYNMQKLIAKQFSNFRQSSLEFTPDVLVLPYSKYGLLTGSIRNPDAHKQLENDIIGFESIHEVDNQIGEKFLNTIGSSKYVHFSDYPLFKPWKYRSMYEVHCNVKNRNPDSYESYNDLCSIWSGFFQEYLNMYYYCKYIPSSDIELPTT